MMEQNLHKLYYKDYYCYKRDKDDKSVSFKFLLSDDSEIKKNSEKLNAVNTLLTTYKLPKKPPYESFYKEHTVDLKLKTLYPGLITGVGLDHEAGVEGEFKLGVHFDYTYGMPVIYGSTVKGVLHSYFKDFVSESILELKGKEEKALDDIFEGKRIDGSLKPMYERDVFFDAVIVRANAKGKILDSDTICPHTDGPLKNPKPITFLKIASGVTIQFRFKLVQSTIGDLILTTENKFNIFKKILTEVGIGAKTNVGYGQLYEEIK